MTIPNKGHLFLKSEGHVPILNKNTGIASGISYSSGVMTGTQNSKQHIVEVEDMATSQPEPINEDLFHSKTSEDETGEKSVDKETEPSEEKTGGKSPIADKARKLSNYKFLLKEIEAMFSKRQFAGGGSLEGFQAGTDQDTLSAKLANATNARSIIDAHTAKLSFPLERNW